MIEQILKIHDISQRERLVDIYIRLINGDNITDLRKDYTALEINNAFKVITEIENDIIKDPKPDDINDTIAFYVAMGYDNNTIIKMGIDPIALTYFIEELEGESFSLAKGVEQCTMSLPRDIESQNDNTAATPASEKMYRSLAAEELTVVPGKNHSRNFGKRGLLSQKSNLCDRLCIKT